MRDAWIYSDEPARGAAIARQLAELGFRPRQVVANGSLRPSGSDGALTRRPELAVVLGEPDVCERLRADEELADVPLVLGLDPDELGAALPDADELLVGPFTGAELEARVARAQRRVNGADEDVVRVGSLELNLANYQVAIGGRPVDFTYMEYELLKFLVTHPGKVFSREALLNGVWGYDYYGGARTVDVHVRRLRAKLGQEHAARIVTVRSVGYRFDP
jgi:DNA-binding response OmpR family regulator